MKIELKNVKINEAFSEETTCFMADVHINGKKVAYAKNDGHGGCTFYHAYEGQRELLEQAEKVCKGLPKEKFDFGGGRVHEFEQSLESVIDKLLSEKELEKEQKKIKKLCETHIVWGAPKGVSYKFIGFKDKLKFDDMKKSVGGQIALNNLIDKVKKELKEGEIIFNENLLI